MSHAIRAALASEHGPDAFAGSVWQQASSAAASHAPYLRRLMTRRPDLLASPDEAWAERILHDAIGAANAIAQAPPSIEEAMVILRRADDTPLPDAVNDDADANTRDAHLVYTLPADDTYIIAVTRFGVREGTTTGQYRVSLALP